MHCTCCSFKICTWITYLIHWVSLVSVTVCHTKLTFSIITLSRLQTYLFPIVTPTIYRSSFTDFLEHYCLISRAGFSFSFLCFVNFLSRLPSVSRFWAYVMHVIVLYRIYHVLGMILITSGSFLFCVLRMPSVIAVSTVCTAHAGLLVLDTVAVVYHMTLPLVDG